MKASKCLIAAIGVSLFATASFAMPSTEPANREATFKVCADRLAKKVELVKKGGSKVVFIGDSITHNWENSPGRQQWDANFAGAPYHALNLGYSGDRTESTLLRIEQGELDGYEAKCIVLMIGTNNKGLRKVKETPVDTIAGIWRVIQAIQKKQPKARIILHPIFPRGEKADDVMRVHGDTVNLEISKFADGKKIIWCDFTDQFLKPDGTLPHDLMPDYLHPKAPGYEIWASAIKPMIDFCLIAGEDDVCPGRYSWHLEKMKFANVKPRATAPHSEIGVKHSWDPGENWWLERMIQKREDAQKFIKEKNGEIDLVFIGDSITHNWEGARGPGPGSKQLAKLRETYSVLDLGYGGDDTRDVLWRVRNGEIDGYKAKCIQLMIGTNNGGDPKDTAQGIRLILDEIAKRQPQAKTLLLAIFPCGQKPDDKARLRNNKVNDIIKGYADGKKVIWCDFGKRFTEPDGTILKSMMGDFLHPGPKGYDIWVEEMGPYYKEICGK